MFFLTAARKTGARRGGFCRRARACPAGAVFAAPLVGKTPALRRKKTRRKFLPHSLWGKRRAPLFKPQGNSIIPKRKFVTTFQKRRAPAGAPFCARRGAKAVSKKRRGRVYAGRKSGEQEAARQGVRRARKAMWTVGQRFCCSFFVPNMRTYLLCAQFQRRSRSARFAAGAPPYSAAAFLPIRRFHFRAYVPAAIKLFRVQAVGSFSGVYSQKIF